MRRTIWLCALLTTGTASAQEPIAIARPDAFKTLVNPMCSHCRDEARRRAGELQDDDRVLCWLRGYSDGGAIPYRFFLNRYRVISDTYGVFVHDPDAGFARGFVPSLDFAFHGWRNGVMVMRHKDGTIYSCLTGVAFAGPRKGDRLAPVPTLVSNWGDWLGRYPRAVAYHMFDKYQPVELPAAPNAAAAKSRGTPDQRLGQDTEVLGACAGAKARVYPLKALAKTGLIADVLDGKPCVVLWHGPTRTAAAYRPCASPPKKGPPARALTLTRDNKQTAAPFTDQETGSHWDIAGRAVDGELKDWTLEWLDGTQIKWFAWVAEYPHTTIYGAKKEAGDKQAEAAIKEVAGSAEFLRAVPKKFAVLTGADVHKRTVTLRIDGDKADTTWPLTAEAEIKVRGWWGRLAQLEKMSRVWAWFHVDRARKPKAIFMLADAGSEPQIHGRLKPTADFARAQKQQQAWLQNQWLTEGLPGTIGVLHVYNGEADMILDHEAMRWGRSLRRGDKVELAADPPIHAVVKSAAPEREKTRVRLVVRSFDLADLKIGQRIHLKMPPPALELQEALLPPDIDAPRKTREERIDWFLASIYCTCKIGGDGCTGQFYTLSCCNPNTCGMPKRMRKMLADKIDRGLSDREIFEQLHKQQGPMLLQPHLLP
jgi:hypothetical protein